MTEVRPDEKSRIAILGRPAGSGSGRLLPDDLAVWVDVAEMVDALGGNIVADHEVALVDQLLDDQGGGSTWRRTARSAAHSTIRLSPRPSAPA